ncbi:MAG: ABC transporter permease subunit [Aestuariivita sp.]|nr:ABC transporter permease subunit [Aestuariivita sp.]
MRNLLPIFTVVGLIVAVWYAAVAPMNIRSALDQLERSDHAVVPAGALERREVSVWYLLVNNPNQIAVTYDLERSRLPTPTQIGYELWKSTGEMLLRGKAMSKRSLLYHGWVTLQSTLWGFFLGTTVGVMGAIFIVYSRIVELSLMPWAIISQTIPIVALAPMIIVLSSQIGIESRGLPKAMISAYLCFFPVLVGLTKGLRSPALSQMDLLKTYNASSVQVFFKLRLPASVPFLFTSLKVGIAAALVGTIVGELPTGAISGLGARILIGDQFGNPLAIWAALFAAAIIAGILVTFLDLLQRFTLHQMGMRV